jgi:transcriptional regulator with XRE-family HTH domain
LEPTRQFADNLRRARERQALSQERLAALADLHPTQISRLERGVRDPRLSTIVTIANALQTPPAELLRGIGNVNPTS